MKVFVNGKRIYSLFGLNWKEENNSIIFRKPVSEGYKVIIYYDIKRG